VETASTRSLRLIWFVSPRRKLTCCCSKKSVLPGTAASGKWIPFLLRRLCWTSARGSFRKIPERHESDVTTERTNHIRKAEILHTDVASLPMEGNTPNFSQYFERNYRRLLWMTVCHCWFPQFFCFICNYYEQFMDHGWIEEQAVVFIFVCV